MVPHATDPLLLRQVWYTHMSLTSYSLLYGIPIGSFFFIIFLLRVVWKPKQPKYKLPTEKTSYGTNPATSPSDSTSPSSSLPSSSATSNMESPKGITIGDEPPSKFMSLRLNVNKTVSADAIHPGTVAGTYEANWLETFDFIFFLGMIGSLAFLALLTSFYKPELWSNGEFWIYMIPKLLSMIGISLFGGLICQYFCVIDDKGYVIATRGSTFKVNYTRKMQHFAAYLVPLIMKPSPACNCSGPLELAWSDFFTLLGFLVLIKPMREKFKLFMLQFNSLDRPEDRPHTLNWIVVGNIVPGLILLLFFRWLFQASGQGNLVFIIVFITGIGDGLAEPIGIFFGKHKYSTRSCFSKRKYTRSYEGSACVFLSGMIFPAFQYRDFATSTQLWLAMLLLPPIVAYAEATAPHTMDTPVLMILTGLVLYGIIQLC